MTSNIAGHIREVLLGMACVLHDLVLKEGCELRCALGSAGRPKTSALAGERDQELLGATPATNPGEGNTRCRASSYLRPFSLGGGPRVEAHERPGWSRDEGCELLFGRAHRVRQGVCGVALFPPRQGAAGDAPDVAIPKRLEKEHSGKRRVSALAHAEDRRIEVARQR